MKIMAASCEMGSTACLVVNHTIQRKFNQVLLLLFDQSSYSLLVHPWFLFVSGDPVTLGENYNLLKLAL